MVKIFIDFDGTITKQDVGDAMFETFGGTASVQAVEEYRQGTLSAVECFKRESSACGEFEKAALDNFLDAQEIDPTFIDFTRFCRQRGLDHIILSDGMDYYITRILHRYGIGDVPFFSNHMDLVPSDETSTTRFHPTFPYTDETCDRCASCKRNHMLTLTSDDDIIVYIGEGYSDRCPARYADAIFAKDDLLKYCQQENIPFFEYQTFGDVVKRLSVMLDGQNHGNKIALRKRRRAELARHEAFIGE